MPASGAMAPSIADEMTVLDALGLLDPASVYELWSGNNSISDDGSGGGNLRRRLTEAAGVHSPNATKPFESAPRGGAAHDCRSEYDAQTDPSAREDIVTTGGCLERNVVDDEANNKHLVE